MFADAAAFNQDLNQWDMSACSRPSCMRGLPVSGADPHVPVCCFPLVPAAACTTDLSRMFGFNCRLHGQMPIPHPEFCPGARSFNQGSLALARIVGLRPACLAFTSLRRPPSGTMWHPIDPSIDRSEQLGHPTDQKDGGRVRRCRQVQRTAPPLVGAFAITSQILPPLGWCSHLVGCVRRNVGNVESFDGMACAGTPCTLPRFPRRNHAT